MEAAVVAATAAVLEAMAVAEEAMAAAEGAMVAVGAATAARPLAKLGDASVPRILRDAPRFSLQPLSIPGELGPWRAEVAVAAVEEVGAVRALGGGQSSCRAFGPCALQGQMTHEPQGFIPEWLLLP